MVVLTRQHVVAVATSLLVSVAVGCGTANEPDATGGAQEPEAVEAAAPEPEPRSSGSACETPTGQEKAAVRFAVRSHDGTELRDEPWATVRKGRRHYIAAEIDNSGPRLIVVVVYADDAKYLSGLRAVNGTARTFTDLPPAGDGMPAAATSALDCLDQ
jgi:hypothetical protein